MCQNYYCIKKGLKYYCAVPRSIRSTITQYFCHFVHIALHLVGFEHVVNLAVSDKPRLLGRLSSLLCLPISQNKIHVFKGANP
jgi:hypothetical protein